MRFVIVHRRFGYQVGRAVAVGSPGHRFGEQLDDYIEAVRDEAAAPLRAELTASQEQATALRDVLIGEVLRVAKLTADDPEKFDLEAEKAFLETLRPDQLKLHFERARAQKVQLKANTSAGDAPEGEKAAEDAAFGNVSVH